MVHTNRFSIVRTGYSILIAFIFVAGNILLCSIAQVLFDKFICLLAINICFFCIFLLSLIRSRLDEKLPEATFTTYGKATLVVAICWLFIILCSIIIPNFFAPLIVIPIIAKSVFNDSLVNIFGIYLVVITSITFEYNINIVLCQIVMIMFGCAISGLLNNTRSNYRIYTLLSMFAITVLTSVVFYYFNYLELTTSVLLYGIGCGISSCILTILALTFLYRYVSNAQETIYDSFLNENYILYNEIKNFSLIEYEHSIRVSSLARKCAKAIDADEALTECAAFYYRLGKLEGEPIIDNAVKLANNYCLPYKVIQILYEYGGIVSMPSTRESAIVHMVDSIVTKVELFDSDSMSSSWNQNMVIYQTINELSQKGFYDNSGLTMNQFLIIREILANEDILG